MRPVKLALLSFAALAAAPLLTVVTVSPAQAQISIDIGVAPPPLRIETPPPAPGPAFVWQPGHWRWEGGHHVWHHGIWARPPIGFTTWVAPHWDQRPNGRWVFVEGYWH